MLEPVVALARLASYGEKNLSSIVGDILDKSWPTVSPGSRILVKPNLLLARELACASPEITAAVCGWLLDRGAKLVVSDSPAFGAAAYVARKIGLEAALKPLGLRVVPFAKTRSIKAEFDFEGKRERGVFKIAAVALEVDEIYSVARVKAHSQTRLTLCAKNCFGCVPGWRKALVHASHGQTTEIFAAFLAELYKSLPPVKGVADGVIAMHITGPAKGAPYPLGLVGASNLATALDEAIIRALKRPVADFPLAARFGASKEIFYPFLKPEDFDANGFILPEKLKPASFSPVRLLKSAIKRLWMSGKS